MRSIEQTLTLWAAGLLSSKQVVEWAGRRIAELDAPPYELIELVTDGPESCLKRSEGDFAPRPRRLTYQEGFAIRALALDLSDNGSVAEFVKWTSASCMGEDLDHPFVALGYRLDHLVSDCDDRESANELVRSALPALLAECSQIAKGYAETEA